MRILARLEHDWSQLGLDLFAGPHEQSIRRGLVGADRDLKLAFRPEFECERLALRRTFAKRLVPRVLREPNCDFIALAHGPDQHDQRHVHVEAVDEKTLRRAAGFAFADRRLAVLDALHLLQLELVAAYLRRLRSGDERHAKERREHSYSARAEWASCEHC